jgi:hypothetical protein
MRNFLAKNWFNVATLTIAICALIISLAGNAITLSANTPRVEIIGNYISYGIISVTGCYEQNVTSHYQINRRASEILTFVNRGGRAVSLIKASFSEGTGNYFIVNFYEVDPNNQSNQQQLKLPLDLNAGAGRIWLVETTNSTNWVTVNDALDAINFQDPQSRINPEIPRPAFWRFEFSDGSTVIHEYTAGWYHIQPSIDVQLENSPCTD